MSGRAVQVQTFASFTYIQFKEWRAKYTHSERGLVIQKLTMQRLPRHQQAGSADMTLLASSFWEWLDTVDYFCESEKQAKQLFADFLDLKKVPA